MFCFTSSPLKADIPLSEFLKLIDLTVVLSADTFLGESMSEPTGPTSAESDGWPPKPPMNPNPQAAYTQPQYQQVYVEKAPSVLEGEKLAKTSTILGIISVCIGGLILGPMAIVKAARAEKLGVDSTVGKVTGWIGTIWGAIYVLLVILYVFFFAALVAGLAASDSSDIKTGEFSNSQDLKQDPNDGPRSSFDKTYEKLTPAEKAQMDQMLEQLDAEVSSR
jgi:hypothetical protein